MIKNYSTYIKESIKHFEFDEENEEDEFEVGDYVTLTKIPPEPHWLNDVNMDKRKTFKILGPQTVFGTGRIMWITDGPNKIDIPIGYGIPDDCIRLATPKEIYKEYGIKENIDYDDDDLEYEEEPDWNDDDMLENIPQNKIRRGTNVLCIKDCENLSYDGIHPHTRYVKSGEIKTIKGIGSKENIWFDDTPTGAGSFNKKNFIVL